MVSSEAHGGSIRSGYQADDVERANIVSGGASRVGVCVGVCVGVWSRAEVPLPLAGLSIYTENNGARNEGQRDKTTRPGRDASSFCRHPLAQRPMDAPRANMVIFPQAKRRTKTHPTPVVVPPLVEKLCPENCGRRSIDQRRGSVLQCHHIRPPLCHRRYLVP